MPDSLGMLVRLAIHRRTMFPVGAGESHQEPAKALSEFRGR